MQGETAPLGCPPKEQRGQLNVTINTLGPVAHHQFVADREATKEPTGFLRFVAADGAIHDFNPANIVKIAYR